MSDFDWSKVRLLLAVITVRGVHPHCMRSVFDTIAALSERGAKVMWRAFDAPKQELARGQAALALLETQEGTHLFFVDDDVEFPPDVALRLIERDVDVCAAAYRMKHSDPLAISFAAAVNEEETHQEIDRGTIKIAKIAGGLLVVKRAAIERLRDAHPELVYRWDTNQMLGIFDSYVENGIWQSDDWAFSLRCRALGIDRHLLVDAMTVHHGGCAYPGNFKDLWAQRSSMRPTGAPGRRGVELAAPALPSVRMCDCKSGKPFAHCHGAPAIIAAPTAEERRAFGVAT